MFIFASVLVQCSRHPQEPKPLALHPAEQLNVLILKELSTKRVVFFGDAYPGHITYSRCLTSFLGFWLDRLQQYPADTTVPRQVALALELGQPGADILNEYLRTGDRYPLLRFLIDEQMKFNGDMYRTRELSVDYVQFCERLRLVKMRVDSLNHQSANYAISLDVIGPEPEPPYGALEIRGTPRQDFNKTKSRWDAFERDRQTSSKLMHYLAGNPGARLLIFSAASHTLRTRGDGIFLAHYLDSLVGRNNVSVFQTRRVLRDPVSGPQIEEHKHDGESHDFLVRKSATPPYPFPFFIVRSQNTLRAMVDLAEQYSTSSDTLERDRSRSLLGHALELLRCSHVALDPKQNSQIAIQQSIVAAATRKAILSSSTFPDIRRLVSRFDPVCDVVDIDSVMVTFTPSQDYRNALTTLIDNLRRDSSSISINPRVITNYRSVEEITEDWARTWRDKKADRRTYMLLQILWLGTPKEVTETMTALKQETGKDFSSAVEWEDWWQSTQEGTSR